jgi:hypothetical protein
MSVGGFGNGNNSLVTDGLVYYFDAYNTKSVNGVNTIYDLTKNGNNGSFSGPGSAGSSYSGNSLTFDGNAGFSNVLNSTSLDSFTTGLTVNIFVKFNDVPSANGENYDSPILKCSSGSWTDGFGFYIDAASGEFRFFVNHYNNFKAGHSVGTGPTAIPLTNYCGVYDGSNVLLYSDGDLLVTGDALTSNVINSGLQMNIGCGNDVGGNARYYASCTTYLIMIYDRALTPTEISNNHNVLNYRFR